MVYLLFQFEFDPPISFKSFTLGFTFLQVNSIETTEPLCPIGISNSDEQNLFHLCAYSAEQKSSFEYSGLKAYFENELKATQTQSNSKWLLKSTVRNRAAVTYDYDTG